MDEIEELLRDNKITLVITETGIPGFYVPSERAIFVDQDLPYNKQKEVILHELAHALDHTELKPLYNTPVFHSKMESQADSFMINYLIEENEGHYNYSGIIDEFNLGLGWECNLK